MSPQSHTPRRSLFVLVLLTALLAAGTLGAQPQDDVIALVDTQVLILSKDRLLANDSDPSATLTLDEGPRFGRLEEYPTYFTYEFFGPAERLLVEDSFTYRLKESVRQTTARVTLRVTARRLPVTGRFFAAGTVDFGYFDGFARGFRICRQGFDARDCASYRAPAGPRGSLPARVDWDGDGLDEPVLYDPETGRLEILDLPSDGTGQMTTLAIVETFERHAVPVNGHLGVGMVGLWIHVQSDLLLVEAASAPAVWTPSGILSTDTPGEQAPVARVGPNGPELGLFSYDKWRVDWHLLEDGSPPPPQTLRYYGNGGPFLSWIKAAGAEHYAFFDPDATSFLVTPATPVDSQPMLVDIDDEPSCEWSPSGDTC